MRLTLFTLLLLISCTVDAPQEAVMAPALPDDGPAAGVFADTGTLARFALINPPPEEHAEEEKP